MLALQEQSQNKSMTTDRFLRKIFGGLHPDESFILFSGSSSRWHWLCLDAHEVDFDEGQRLFQGQRASGQDTTKATQPPFRGGYAGIMPYDFLIGQLGSLPRCFFTTSLIAFDSLGGILYLYGDAASQTQRIWQELTKTESSVISLQPTLLLPIPLTPQETDPVYLNKVAHVISDIKAGAYYQLNLLRRFSLVKAPDFNQLNGRFCRFSGPFSCWFRRPDWEIVSFSPERMLKIETVGAGSQATVQPIKGTIKNVADPKVSESLGLMLLGSSKNLAELHMIVDLLRNDLYRVSEMHSVQVKHAHELVKFPTVQHLMATVVSRLQNDITFKDLLTALFPGGSITGAPKKAVISAIDSYESQKRGYFMGNAFVWDQQSGYFDSSILIRTIVRNSSTWQYAAGSGLVAHSDPESEAQEIRTKCRILTLEAD